MVRLATAAALASGLVALTAQAQDAKPISRPEMTGSVGHVGTTAVSYRGVRASTTQVISQNTPGLFPIGPAGMGLRGCPPVTESVAANFNALDVGSEITVQLGLRQNEGFGAIYNVPSGNFPVEINMIEQIFATVANGGGTISCGYTIEVYDGDPTAGGVLVYNVTSDPDPSGTGLPGDMVLQRLATCSTTNGAQASVGKLQFSVDQTADPQDRWIVNNISGQNRFAVIVRITRMNQPTASPCLAAEPPCNNIFLCTEANNGGTLNFASRNLLDAIDCGAGPLVAPAGVSRFDQLSILFRPTRDVLQQVTYTSLVCTPPATGACCNASTGGCSVLSQSQCSGAYQGDNTTCSPNPCPQPSGACCLPDGSCEVRESTNCTGTGFIFRGGGSVCASANCPLPTGACCNGNACAAGVTSATCATLGGIFIGPNTVCGANSTCPLGACCLASGACSAGLSQNDCTTQGGTFQGVGSVCASVNCPQPSGACCTSAGGCADVTQATCGLFGGTWQGPLTTCANTNCSSNIGTCCRGATCAEAVQASSCTGANTAFVPGSAVCSGSATTPCCKADFNKVGGITVQDIFDFLTAWFNGDVSANIAGNGSGPPTVQSIFDFLGAWFAGGC